VCAGGAEVVLWAVLGLFWWTCCGGGGERATYVRQHGANRAKAFTDALSVVMMAAPLWCRSPRWGHHGEAPCSLPHGALKVKTSSIYGRAMATFWRRALLEDIVLGVTFRLLLVVVVLRVACLVHVVVEVLRAHGC
jgi:hypothetical protein